MEWKYIENKIKPGDRIGILSWFADAYFDVDGNCNIIFNRNLQAKCFLSHDWQIIPAKPVVLSAEEIIDKAASCNIAISWSFFEDVKKYINICRDNFRLERDNELKPAIEAAQNSIMGGRIEENALEEILLNLPPLNKNE